LPSFLSTLYDRVTRRWPARRLSRWKSGGIMLTYRCNAECADCYENSSPRKRALLPPEHLRNYLRELRRLGFSGPRLHFGGGEPFYHYKHLIECFRVAGEEGMLPLGKLETNGVWCKTDELTRERLEEIKSFGLLHLHVSSDVFHQEFIPIENVRRAVRIGQEVLGKDAVRVGLREFFDDPVDVAKLTQEEKTEAHRDVLKRYPWRIVGRAAKRLSHLADRYPKEKFLRESCARRLVKNRSIHIDPHGNVFPSICAGIVIGNANEQPLSEIHEQFERRAHPLVDTLARSGPVPLLEEAIQCGYADTEKGFATKCHLCFEARRFFWERGLHADEVGPGEIYTD